MAPWRHRILYFATKLGILWRSLWSRPQRNAKLALHCMFRNEAPYLAEWLDYHFALGVDYIYLTNDQSEDHYAAVLAPYREKGLLECSDARRDLDFYQREQYHKNQVLAQAQSRFQWVGFLDSDEFLAPEPGLELKAALEQYRRGSGVVLNWFIYGTAHCEELAPGQSLLATMNRRFPDGHREHEAVKSIVQTGYGQRFFNHNPHYPQYLPWRPLLRVNGQRFRPAEPQILGAPLRINHYWYRSERYFREQKRPRRQFFEGGERSAILEDWHYRRSNAVYDPMPSPRLEAMQRWCKEMGI